MISDRPEEARCCRRQSVTIWLPRWPQSGRQKLAEDAVSNAPVKDVFRNSGLMKLVILNFFYQTGDYGYTLWLPTILKG